jgi:lipopolysaccharide export system protein LptC
MTLLALSLGALGSAILLQLNTSDDAGTEFGPRLSIGYYMNEAQLSGTGDDGRILYQARAASAAQDLEDGTVKLQDVYVTYDPATEIPWALQANSGRIPRDGNIIELRGNVVARTRDEGRPPMTIRTDYLELDTETYIADTQEKVAIDYTSNKVFATGMRAFFKEDRLQLLSNVNGKFVP